MSEQDNTTTSIGGMSFDEAILAVHEQMPIRTLPASTNNKSTRYYIDLEFIDDGHTIDPISIGIVCEDGRELHLQSTDFEPGHASSWVWDNVFTHLDICTTEFDYPITTALESKASHKLYRTGTYGKCELHTCLWRTREQIRDEIIQFLGVESFDLFGWCSGYDFVAFTQLFGTMMDLPAFYPHYIRDLQQVLDEYGITDSDLPQQEEGLHNALSDARHIKRLWEYVANYTSKLTQPILPPYVG